MVKTLKLRILPNDEQIAALNHMSEQYRQACNFVSQYTFDNGIESDSGWLLLTILTQSLALLYEA